MFLCCLHFQLASGLSFTSLPPFSIRAWFHQHSAPCSSCYQGTECSKPQLNYNLNRTVGLYAQSQTPDIHEAQVVCLHKLLSSQSRSDETFCVILQDREWQQNESDYLVCVREHEDHEFLHYISGVDCKEVFQLVYRHESADLKGKVRANITFTD